VQGRCRADPGRVPQLPQPEGVPGFPQGARVDSVGFVAGLPPAPADPPNGQRSARASAEWRCCSAGPSTRRSRTRRPE
jgi:hypothetical protein